MNRPVKNALFLGLTAIAVLGLLPGCGLQALTSSINPSTATAPAVQGTSTTTMESTTEGAAAQDTTTPLTAADARQTVLDFLTAVQLDADSALARQLLSPDLEQEAAAGQLQATLLKTSETIPSFEVGAAKLSTDGREADVEATLFTQQPLNLNFSLVDSEGMWKINEIRLVAAGGDYPETPEGVVQAFLIAYQERPDNMSDYLTDDRRANQPPGGSVGMLQILGSLEGMLVKSVVVIPEPPQAVIGVTIKAGGIESERQFILSRENERWGIDQIMTTQ